VQIKWQSHTTCVILTFFLSFSASCFAEDTLILEGVSIIGSYKTAFLSVNGTKISLNKGDYAGGWRIEEVEPRLIKLRSDKGEAKELALQSRLSEVPPKQAETPQPNNGDNNANNTPPADGEKDKNAPQPFQPRQIDDKDVPAGHHKVRTPFGDVIVKDNP